MPILPNVALPFLLLAVELMEQCAGWNNNFVIVPWNYDALLKQMSPTPQLMYRLHDTEFSCLAAHLPSGLIRVLLGNDAKLLDMFFTLFLGSYVTVESPFLLCYRHYAYNLILGLPF